MRTFAKGDGSDSTAAVLAHLAAHKELWLADLYLIGELEDSMGERLTDWESPLSWPLWGTFNTATVTRGRVKSKFGLEVENLEVTWAPKVAAAGTSLATANKYQLAHSGFYDNKKFRLWRLLMPTPGDANTLGGCEWFGGRIAETKVERAKITFKVNSFLDVINQPTPPNVIELNNTAANFAGNTPVVSDGETQIPQFTVVAGSTSSKILADCTGPTLGKIYGTNKFQYGYIVFNRGSSLAGYWSPVAQSLDHNAGGGIHYNEFDVYGGFPWDPTPGDTFYASIKPPINLQDSAVGFAYFGFPFVPPPETAA